MTDTDIVAELASLLDGGGVLTGSDVSEHAATWSGGTCAAKAIVRPRTTDEVAAILALCNRRGQAVVVQGGKTGMVDGAVAAPGEIALSLERMNAIESIDRAARTMTVQAGAPLQAVHEAAEAAGLMFPLDLGARGSATIGGNISTNAGGNGVIRYGMTRELVLGVEAVLADGTVVSSMTPLIKNNTGVDLKQLFIGSEGTLGVVTRAVLKLFTLPASRNTVLAATDRFERVCALLEFAQKGFSGQLTAFEVMWNSYYRLATNAQGSGRPSPLSRDYPFYVLIETRGPDITADAEQFERLLGNALEQGLVVDAVLARSEGERNALWEIRDNIASFVEWWPVFIYDVSVPVILMSGYLDEVASGLAAAWPDAGFAVFGHLGDGNLHLVIAVGSDDAADHHRANEIVYRPLASRRGSISAEHGIGLGKRDYLHYSRTPAEIALMRTLKRTLDPNNILNPGRILGPVDAT